MDLLSRRNCKFCFLAVFLFFLPFVVPAQDNTSAVSSKDRPAMKAAVSSVVQVLTGQGDGQLESRGAGVIIRTDGVILTSFELVKHATQVQVRLANGEIFDRVDLLNYDERRGVAALKISGSNFPAVMMRADDVMIGDQALVLSNSDGRTWEAAEGTVKTNRLADEIPDAGNGFRVFQISASVGSQSNGGLVTDSEGCAIGLVVDQMRTGNRSHIAIPISSVSELGAVSSKTMSFRSGQTLDLNKPVRPPSAIEVVNSDPASILKNAKLFYVDSDSFYIKSEMMQNAMMRYPEFKDGSLKLVVSKDTADILVFVEHKLFTWDYRYRMTDRRTGIILASEKVTVWDGKAASKKFAKKILAILRKHKTAAPATKNTTD